MEYKALLRRCGGLAGDAATECPERARVCSSMAAGLRGAALGPECRQQRCCLAPPILSHTVLLSQNCVQESMTIEAAELATASFGDVMLQARCLPALAENTLPCFSAARSGCLR